LILLMHYETLLLVVRNAGRFSGTESGRQATEALGKAAEMLAGGIPGRRPDAELARAWAEIGQGWAALSHAEAARSIAAVAFAVDQGGVNTFPA
jgi:hypothetical protein